MFKIILQGFFIGAGKMIPGFSGSLLAITFGVYEKALEIIAHLRTLTIGKIIYLLSLGMGIILGIISFSYIVKFLIHKIYFPIMLLFTGLIIGNLKETINNIKGYNHPIRAMVYFLLSLLSVLIISSKKTIYSISEIDEWLFLPLGIVESFTTLIPGVSGTAVYMLLGVYDVILNLYIDFTNLGHLLCFGSGFIVGTIILSKVLTVILKKYSKQLFIVIFGFMFSAILILVKDAFNSSFNFLDLLLGLFFFIFGYVVSKKLNHLF